MISLDNTCYIKLIWVGLHQFKQKFGKETPINSGKTDNSYWILETYFPVVSIYTGKRDKSYRSWETYFSEKIKMVASIYNEKSGNS